MKPEITQAMQKWFFRSKVYANALHIDKSVDDQQQIHSLGLWLDEASDEFEKALSFLTVEQRKRFNFLGLKFVQAQSWYIGDIRLNTKYRSSRTKERLAQSTLNYENTKFNVEAFLMTVAQ